MKLFLDDLRCEPGGWTKASGYHDCIRMLQENKGQIEEISLDIKKHISHMGCQVPLGSTQAISDGMNHSIVCTLSINSNVGSTCLHTPFIVAIKGQSKLKSVCHTIHGFIFYTSYLFAIASIVL